MTSNRTSRWPSWASVTLLVGAGFCGCQSILGIEELSTEARPGTGAGAQGGSSGNDGSGGAGPSFGGSTNQGGGNGGDGTGLAPGGGGTGGSQALDAGSDAAPAGPIVVAGRVIDFLRRPVPDVPITIGAQNVLTDDNGQFSIPDVEPPYTVSLIAATTRDGFGFRYYAYVYEGLTRPDPTLQVYEGLIARDGDLDVTLTGANFTDPNRGVILAFSSADADYSASTVDVEMTSGLTVNWAGPAQTAGTAHGLLVLRSGSSGGEPPLAYESYQTAPLALTDNATSSISLDVSAQTIAQVNLTGSVDSGSFGTQTRLISLRFDDGTLLPLLDDDSTGSAFSYLIPTLPSTSLIVAASAGSAPYVLAHTDGVPAAAGQNVSLTLPRPVALSGPAGGSDLGTDTLFSWSTLGQTAGVYVWHLESDGYFEGIYVITSRSQIEFPRVPGYSMRLSPPPPAMPFDFYWSVETHGDYASVDAAAGPTGFFDSFARDRTIPTGPARGNGGYFTDSEIRIGDLVSQ